ncbi:MAG: glycosyltransferase family A protein [Negativicutes bacterium]|jgi:glycosyltransferase involved in cell wall biosynthesis
MKIAVIIATRNRKSELCKALLSLNRQTFLPVEVIIVDSSDELITFDADMFSKLSIKLFRSISSLVVQRNTGLKQVSVTTDVIVFLDDDVELENDYLEKLVQVFWIARQLALKDLLLTQCRRVAGLEASVMVTLTNALVTFRLSIRAGIKI